MKVKAIVGYFGSKRGMAPDIIEALGPHRSYWEVPCGSLAVLLAKDPCGNEVACDLHDDLTNLAWVLQCPKLGPQLYGMLGRTLMSEALFCASVERCKVPFVSDEPNQYRAYDYMVMSWMGRSGIAGTNREDSSICVRWTASGGSAAARWRSVVDSVPAWHERLRNVLILRRDLFDVLPKIEDEVGTAVYCDPPYLISTRKAKGHTARGGGNYRHEFAPEHHERLASELSRFKKARVVVSYYASPKLAELYPGWQQRRFDRAMSLSVQAKRGSKARVAPEVLLVNAAGEAPGLFGEA